jgi:CheY-like chemotaxis protein
VDVLRPALAADAAPIACVAARDVARLMGLTGLDAALAELERHAGRPRPVDVEHLAGRIARMTDTAAADGDLRAFHYDDRELGSLASQLAATEWTEAPPGAAPGVATLAVDEALSGLAIEAPAEALRARVTMTVASALRAAVDWLGADESPRIVVDLHDSALTLSVSALHEGGIGPAGAVLAAVEGSLGREADGRWTIRVATAAERASWLLLRQGRYGVALPWHAVARLRMFAPHELERLAEPRLAPLSTGGSGAGELPAALVASGLVRAWFVADRIVWRIAARAEESAVAGPFASGTRMIEVESGECYWVLEPAWLLRGVAAPDAPPPSPRPRAGTAALPLLPAPSPVAAAPRADAAPAGESLAEAVERALAQLRHERGVAAAPEPAPHPAADAGTPAPEDYAWTAEAAVDAVMFTAAVDVMLPAHDASGEAAPAPEAPAAEAPAPGSLDDDAVAELFDSFLPPASVPADVPPAPAADPVPDFARAPRASELAARVPARRALVADDSLVARIFLGRLLEKRGWIVETVADAASLWDELHRGPWGLVCADIALPDAQGEGHVTRLLHFLGRRPSPTPCIVLTRDGADERIALDAGATLVLRKPFEPERLDSLLPR